MTEIINIDSTKLTTLLSRQQLVPSSQQKIKSYSVCISVADIKRLFEMIKMCKNELMSVNQNDKLIKRLQRIEMVTEGGDIFGPREDKRTKMVYRPENAYIMFYEL